MFSAIRGELHFPPGALEAWKTSTVEFSAYAHMLECLYPVNATFSAMTVAQVLARLPAAGLEVDQHTDEIHFGGSSRDSADADSFMLAAIAVHGQDHGAEGDLFLIDGEREAHGQLFCVLVEVRPDGADAATLADDVARALVAQLRESDTLTREMLDQTLRSLGLDGPPGRAETVS